jgi:hypothetical protein
MGVLHSNLVQNKKAEKECQEGSTGQRENGERNLKQFALATVKGRATVQYTRGCCVNVLVRTTPGAKTRLGRFALDRTGSWTVAATIKWRCGESSQRGLCTGDVRLCVTGLVDEVAVAVSEVVVALYR